MREIIYYVASSADGFIARDDGSFDALPLDENYLAALVDQFPEAFPAPYHQHIGDTAENRVFDTVLMGRATYEVGAQQGLTSPYPTLEQYVVSTTMTHSPDPAVNLIGKNIVERIRELKQQEGKAIWLCGGAELASLLLSAGLISGLIIKLNPVIFGTGIPLFRKEIAPVNLVLTEHQVFPSGHLLLNYTIVQHSAATPGCPADEGSYKP